MEKISARELRAAVDRAGLPPGTFERIQAALVADVAISPGFEAAHVSYYLGALLIIGAMGWFITNAWERLSGLTISAVAIAYGILFGVVGLRLFRKTSTKIPGGLLVAVAVCMTPLAVYGLERAMGWWPASDPGSYTRFHPWIDASWVVMEIATIVVAAVALKFVRFPLHYRARGVRTVVSIDGRHGSGVRRALELSSGVLDLRRLRAGDAGDRISSGRRVRA